MEKTPFSVSEGHENVIDFSRTEFLTLDTVDISGRVLLVMGGLCIVGSLAIPLASVHYMSAASPWLWQPKMSSAIAKCPLGVIAIPVENQCFAIIYWRGIHLKISILQARKCDNGPMWTVWEIWPIADKRGFSFQECLFFQGISRVPLVGMNTMWLKEKSSETDWLPNMWKVLNIIKSVAGSIFEKDD